MGRYECTRCGETMTSKNPMIRSVFPTDQTASMMTNIVNVVTKRGEGNRRTVTFEFPYTDTKPNEHRSDDSLEMLCARMIRDLTDDQLTHWLCDHEWRLVGGEEMAM